MSGAGMFVKLSNPGLPGWVVLPLPGEVDNVAAWARARTLRDSAGQAMGEMSIGVDGAADMLAAVAERAASLWPPNTLQPMSLAWQPDPLGPVFALCDAAVFRSRDDAMPPERMTAEVNGPALGDLEESRLDTPLGPATVITGRFRSEVSDQRVDGGQIVAASFTTVETRTIVIRPPSLPGYVWINAQWQELQLGPFLMGQVDTLARQMVLEVERR